MITRALHLYRGNFRPPKPEPRAEPKSARCPFSGTPLKGGRSGGEVTAAQFEERLRGFRAQIDREDRIQADQAPIVSPRSVSWRIYGESSALLGAPRALLLQFAHPAVQGIVEHSSFDQAPGVRIHDTLKIVYRMLFGPTSEALVLARKVFAMHQRVMGVYAQSRGGIQAGSRYAASQIELLIWVAATITDTNVMTHEAFHGKLSSEEKDQFVRESGELFGLFGLPLGVFPATWDEFRAYFDGLLSSDLLRAEDSARTLAALILRPPTRRSIPFYRLLRQLTGHWLPAELRKDYGLDGGRLTVHSRRAAVHLVGQVVTRLSPEFRYCPERQHAERRLSGKTGRAPEAVPLERLIAGTLGVRRG